jgi:glycosyltransferase involved in cell wall biosynthesis
LPGHRVAYVTPLHFGPGAYFGGGERYPLNLARGILAADPRAHVDLVAVGAPARVESLQPRLDVHVLEVTLPGRGEFDHVASSLVDVLEDADLVHIHQAFTRPSQVALAISKFLNKPVTLTDHGAMTNTVEQTSRYLKLVDLMIFQSQFAADQIATDGARMIIPGGVDDRFFRPAEEPVQRRHVLYVGRQLPHKGVDRLLTALPPELPLVIVGRPYDSRYAGYVRALAATRNVTFMEGADDVALRSLYRQAWATVLPSVHRDAWGRVYQAPELMGFTALESMACGTPAIVSDAAALPEFVRDGETGFVFRSLTELGERLRSLARGEADPDALGRRAREVVEEHYGLAVVGERLWQAYGNLWEREACVS